MNELWKLLAKVFLAIFGLTPLKANSLGSTSKELKRMYEADQAERMDVHIDWPVVNENDRHRRQRLSELLSENSLKSGDDFYYAAMILQHGDKPDHYLLSHILAGIAARSGNKTAVWLSAASLDRYLQNIDKPQVFGTQYLHMHDTGAWTMDPINNDLLPDALRQKYNVPTRKESEKQMLEMAEQHKQQEKR